MTHFDFAGKTVLVTGSSMGIGEAFARELDARGARLVLVARSEDKLRALAAELESAQVVPEDLASPGAAQRVFDEVVERRGIDVDVLINNAGYGIHGPFLGVPLEDQRGQIALNVGALVELTYLFLPIIEQRRGGIIQVASMAAYQPTPYFSVYGATKAFVLSFGEALWAEYGNRGVRVLVVSPGATNTRFFSRAGEAASAGATRAAPEGVVRLALEAFQKRGPSVVHGFANRAATLLGRVLPRAAMAKAMARISAPKRPALPASGS